MSDLAETSNSFDERIKARIDELKNEGRGLIGSIGRNYDGIFDDYIIANHFSSFQSWLNSVSNIIQKIAPPDSQYVKDCVNFMSSCDVMNLKSGIVLKMAGLLESVDNDWSRGLLYDFEYIYVAETFDQFLDHAKEFHRTKRKNEASILASVVLEDSIKKICKKNGIDSEGQSLEPLIDLLMKKNVITKVKARRIKGYSAVRNKALHTEWDKFDLDDVGSMINGIRELIDQLL